MTAEWQVFPSRASEQHNSVSPTGSFLLSVSLFLHQQNGNSSSRVPHGAIGRLYAWHIIPRMLVIIIYPDEIFHCILSSLEHLDFENPLLEFSFLTMFQVSLIVRTSWYDSIYRKF